MTNGDIFKAIRLNILAWKGLRRKSGLLLNFTYNMRKGDERATAG